MNPSDSQPKPQTVIPEAAPRNQQLDVAQFAPAPEQAPAAAPAEFAPQPAAEQAPSAPVATSPVLTNVQVPPVLEATTQAPAVPAPIPDGLPMPAVAADEDVIEKEWVDKTEEVISRTAADPFAEEEAIEALQIEYLQKRYGHEVKKPTD